MIWRFWNQVFGHWEHRQFICMFLLFLDWFYCIIIEFRPEKFHFDRKNPFFRVFFIIIVWVQLSSIWFSLFWFWIVIKNKQLLCFFDNGWYTIWKFFNNVAFYHNYFLQKRFYFRQKHFFDHDVCQHQNRSSLHGLLHLTS